MEVQILNPPNCYKAVSMARNVERKLIKAKVIKALVNGIRKNSISRNYSQSIFHFNEGKYYRNPTTKTT